MDQKYKRVNNLQNAFVRFICKTLPTKKFKEGIYKEKKRKL